jgi:CRP/FNR family transcriptional regulator
VNGAIRLKLALTQEEIAQLVGTTRESITRIFSRLKRGGVLEQNGSTLVILNRAALVRMLVSF